jgi:homocitrate synthase
MNEHHRILQSFRGVIDSTLREGFQFSKANFTPAQQIEIFRHLAGIGVEYVEVANPAKAEIRTMVAGLVAARGRGRTRLLAHIRNHETDVRAAIESGVDGVNILCTVDAERVAAMGKTSDDYRAALRRNAALAKGRGLEVRVGVEDFFKQPSAESLEIYRIAGESGADRIALADTLGRAMSWEVGRRVRRLRGKVATPLEVHFHNDLGHAVSNAFAALEAGANFVSTSLLGIGERTGITPTSSLLVNLYVLDPAVARRYDLGRLTRAENYVARICGIEMPPNLMTNTAHGFAHKAGIHLDALMKFGPQKYELLPPGLIGNRRSLIIETLLSGKTGPVDVARFQEKFG